MKALLVKYYGQYHSSDDYSDIRTIATQEFSGWEEVTEAELSILKAWVNRHPNEYVLFTESDIPAKKAIKEQLKLLEEMRKREAEERAKQEKILAAKREARLLKQQAKTKEQELALLAALQSKYGN